MKIDIRYILLFVSSLWSANIFGQAMANDNALITITTGTEVTVLGGVLNNGDIVNEGSLAVSGDWLNADQYTAGNGLFILNGDDTQNVAHSGQDWYHLIVDGAGEKVFTTDARIVQQLDLTEGIVTPQPGVVLHTLDGSIINGGADDAHINGQLYHDGLGTKFFPIGKNGNYRPVELVNVQGANPMIGFEVFEPNPDPVVPITLLAVSDTRYWQMNLASGTYDGSTLKLKVGPDENLGPDALEEDVVITGTDILSDIHQNLGQSVFTGSLMDGEVTSQLDATNIYFALGLEGIDEERTLFVPNALAPGASDPEDRVIKVYSSQVMDSDFAFRIYNRWGKIVYETTSFTEANTTGWSGDLDGDEEPIGVYHYTVSGVFFSGNTFERNGTITVIR